MEQIWAILADADQKILRKVVALNHQKVLAIVTGYFTLYALWQTCECLFAFFLYLRMYSVGPSPIHIQSLQDRAIQFVNPLLSIAYFWAIVLFVWIVRDAFLRGEIRWKRKPLDVISV